MAEEITAERLAHLIGLANSRWPGCIITTNVAGDLTVRTPERCVLARITLTKPGQLLEPGRPTP